MAGSWIGSSDGAALTLSHWGRRWSVSGRSDELPASDRYIELEPFRVRLIGATLCSAHWSHCGTADLRPWTTVPRRDPPRHYAQRLGDTDRAVARARLMGRRKEAQVRRTAEAGRLEFATAVPK